MLHAWLMFIVLMCVISAVSASEAVHGNTIPLGGTWRFRLDPDNVGVEKTWFAEKLDDTVSLPGSTDTNPELLT